MKTTTLAKTLLATGIAAGLGFSQTTMAQNPTASDELDVEVELAAGLTLTCGALNFGTINVELGERDDSNTVTVDDSGAATIDGDGNAAVAGTDASAATCTISGIDSADTTISATVDKAPLDNGLSGADTGGPQTDYPGTLSVALDLYDDAGSAINPGWNGTAEDVYSGTTDPTSDFIIGGVLTIPDDNFEADNMGKYDATVTIEVEEEDTAT